MLHTMAKRMQERKEDNRIVARSSPTAMYLAVGFCLDKFFICHQSDCVEKPGRYSKPEVDRLDPQGDLA